MFTGTEGRVHKLVGTSSESVYLRDLRSGLIYATNLKCKQANNHEIGRTTTSIYVFGVRHRIQISKRCQQFRTPILHRRPVMIIFDKFYEHTYPFLDWIFAFWFSFFLSYIVFL